MAANLVRQLNSHDSDFASALKKRLAFSAADDAAIDAAAAKILADVQARGDAAILHYTQQFDRLSKDQASSVKALEISKADLLTLSIAYQLTNSIYFRSIFHKCASSASFLSCIN